MSKKISQLPAATQGNATDLLEKSDQGGAPSQKLTLAQLLAFIQANATTFAMLVDFPLGMSAGGTKAQISGNDGAASFGGGKTLLQADGSATFGLGNLGISADGTLDVAGAVQLLPTGAALFANSAFGIAANGSISNSTAFSFAADGSGYVANGVITFAATGDIEITDTTKGVILKSPNGTRYRLKVDNAGNLGTILVP